MRKQLEGGISKPRRAASGETKPANTLILNFQSPEFQENKFLMVKATWSLVFCYGRLTTVIQLPLHSTQIPAPHAQSSYQGEVSPQASTTATRPTHPTDSLQPFQISPSCRCPVNDICAPTLHCRYLPQWQASSYIIVRLPFHSFRSSYSDTIFLHPCVDAVITTFRLSHCTPGWPSVETLGHPSA